MVVLPCTALPLPQKFCLSLCLCLKNASNTSLSIARLSKITTKLLRIAILLKLGAASYHYWFPATREIIRITRQTSSHSKIQCKNKLNNEHNISCKQTTDRHWFSMVSQSQTIWTNKQSIRNIGLLQQYKQTRHCYQTSTVPKIYNKTELQQTFVNQQCRLWKFKEHKIILQNISTVINQSIKSRFI